MIFVVRISRIQIVIIYLYATASEKRTQKQVSKTSEGMQNRHLSVFIFN